MSSIKARLNEGADNLHDKALITAARGRTIVWCLSPQGAEHLSRLLRTEAACMGGDEDHTATGCTVETCTAMAAMAVADHVLGGKEKEA